MLLHKFGKLQSCKNNLSENWDLAGSAACRMKSTDLRDILVFIGIIQGFKFSFDTALR